MRWPLKDGEVVKSQKKTNLNPDNLLISPPWRI